MKLNFWPYYCQNGRITKLVDIGRRLVIGFMAHIFIKKSRKGHEAHLKAKQKRNDDNAISNTIERDV